LSIYEDVGIEEGCDRANAHWLLRG
jgi:hypothetical protein